MRLSGRCGRMRGSPTCTLSSLLDIILVIGVLNCAAICFVTSDAMYGEPPGTRHSFSPPITASSASIAPWDRHDPPPQPPVHPSCSTGVRTTTSRREHRLRTDRSDAALRPLHDGSDLLCPKRPIPSSPLPLGCRIRVRHSNGVALSSSSIASSRIVSSRARCAVVIAVTAAMSPSRMAA